MTDAPALLRCKSCKTVNRVPIDKLESQPICGKCKTLLEFIKTPIHGTSANFKQELDFPGTVLVEFWAKWCGACRLVVPALDEIAHQMAGQIKVIKVDVDEESQLARSFDVQATPTFVLYRNGHKVNQIAGALSVTQMEDWIDRSLESLG